MAVRYVEYLQYILNPNPEQVNEMEGENPAPKVAPRTIGYFVPELALLAHYHPKMIQKLSQDAEKNAELISQLSRLPNDGFFVFDSQEKLINLLSDFQKEKGLYSQLAAAGIPLLGSIQANEVNQYLTGKLPANVSVEPRNIQVKYTHKPHTRLEKWLPKLAYVVAVVVAVGLTVLTVEALAAAGWAMGLFLSIGIGTLTSRYTHIIKTFESKLERFGRAYSRWQSGLYGDLSWGDKTNILGATLATSSFLAGLYWTFLKTMEGALKKFAQPISALYALSTVFYQAGSVLDPVWAQFGITKTRPPKVYALEDILTEDRLIHIVYYHPFVWTLPQIELPPEEFKLPLQYDRLAFRPIFDIKQFAERNEPHSELASLLKPNDKAVVELDLYATDEARNPHQPKAVLV